MQAARVLITGAAGQIAYSLIFGVARGDLLGPNQKIILHLLDIPQMTEALNGVVLEIEDCALPLVEGT
jgi:malate/lactate dehydrogenase